MVDHRFAALRELAVQQHERLKAAAPALGAAGGTLLLGRHYASTDSGTLMLGINPGLAHDGQTTFYADQWGYNPLLDDPENRNIRYWRNAKVLFTQNGMVQREMEYATYSFCSPFRTRYWKGLPKPDMDRLVEYSRPILERILADCRPRTVLIAGREGVGVFERIAGEALVFGSEVAVGGDTRGTYTWRAVSATIDGSPTTIVRIPHLSRASSRQRLAECGAWLAEVLAPTAHADRR